jgi:hypothetical protein
MAALATLYRASTVVAFSGAHAVPSVHSMLLPQALHATVQGLRCVRLQCVSPDVAASESLQDVVPGWLALLAALLGDFLPCAADEGAASRPCVCVCVCVCVCACVCMYMDVRGVCVRMCVLVRAHSCRCICLVPHPSQVRALTIRLSFTHTLVVACGDRLAARHEAGRVEEHDAAVGAA